MQKYLLKINNYIELMRKKYFRYDITKDFDNLPLSLLVDESGYISGNIIKSKLKDQEVVSMITQLSSITEHRINTNYKNFLDI